MANEHSPQRDQKVRQPHHGQQDSPQKQRPEQNPAHDDKSAGKTPGKDKPGNFRNDPDRARNAGNKDDQS